MKNIKSYNNFKIKNNILVIHMKDPSTTFLKPIYKNLNYDLVDEYIEPEDLIEIIKLYDKVLMMGHGTPAGLLNTDFMKKNSNHLIINEKFINVLKNNPNNVYIWCNADKFVNKYKLKGFYTGMFISEVGEAAAFQIKVDQKIVTQSNNLFSKVVALHKGESSKDMYKKAKKHYNSEVAKKLNNPVIEYNSRRLYYR